MHEGLCREPRSAQLPFGAGGAIHQAEKELLCRLWLPVQVHLRGLRLQGKLESYHMSTRILLSDKDFK